MAFIDAATPCGTKGILLAVDDEQDFLFVIGELVNAHLPECQVLTASSAQEGLELALEHPVDGILVEVKMPEIGGIEMCRRLKADERTAHIPVILLTAHRATAELKAEGLDAGAEDFIVKPVDNVELVARIKVVLRIKQAEDDLRRANASLEQLVTERTGNLQKERDLAQSYLDVAGVMFLVINADQMVRFLNRKGCEILRCDEAEAIGANWFDTFLPEEQRDSTKVIFDSLIRGEIESAEYYENPVLTHSGEIRLIAWHNTMLRDERGVIVGTLSSGEDITERKQMEETLLQSSRLIALGQMAAGMAHELNQPLTGISVTAQGYKMLIERGVEITKEGLLEDSVLILEQVERMRQLIEHLRIFSRDRSAEPKEKVLLGDVIYNVLRIIGTQLKSHGIELHLEIAEELPPVLGDPYRLEQVLLNLINNARDALDEKQEQVKRGNLPDWGKRLRVGTHCADGQIIVEVEDTGIGISEMNRQKLFQPFFTTKEPDKGTGLGLSIAYAIVQDHRGTIECQSEEGEGVLFRVVLPAIDSSSERGG
jgi:PAS domain S-box-containing protein